MIRKNKRAIVAACAAVLGLSCRARATDYTSVWDGTAGSWSDSANWLNLPLASTYPNNGGNDAYEVTVAGAGTLTTQLTLSEDIVLSSLSFSNAALIGSAPNGTSSSTGPTLTVQGVFSNGTFSTSALSSGAILNLEGGGAIGDSSSIVGDANTAINNLYSTLSYSGTGTATIAVPFNNDGTLQVNSGTLQFQASGSDSYPIYSAASGGTIDFQAGNRTGGEYSPTIFTGTGGNIDISGGTFTTYGLILAPNVGDSINVAVSGGTQSLGGVHLGANQFDVPGGVATLSISGTATASDGAINVYNGVIQQSGGTLSTGALYIDTNPATPQISTFSAGNISCGTYSSYGFGILLGNSATTEGRIELTGSASLGSQGGEIVGYYGYGKIQQDGGTNVASAGISIADEAGSSGDYIQNAGSLQTSVLNVAPNGNGSFTLTGGKAQVLTDLHVGSSTGSNGTFTLSGGTLEVDETEYIAQAFSDNTVQAYGSGTFIQNGGTHLIPNQQLLVGEQTGGGTGVYNMNGGTLIVGNGVLVGPNGTFNLNHGVANLNGSLPTTGSYADLGVAGTFTIANNADARLTINHFEYIYNSGATPATFHQYGGTQTIAGYLIAGRTAGSSGQYIMDNGYASALNVFVGGDEETAGGTGTFTINGGEFDVGKEATTNTYDGTVHIWPGGTFTVYTGGTLNTGTFTNDGTVNEFGGTYNITSGSGITGMGHINQLNGSLNIGPQTSFNTQDVTLTGGTAVASGTLMVGSGTATVGVLNINGGSLTINGVLGVGNSGTLGGGSGSGSVNVSSGSVYANTVLLASTTGGHGDMTISGSGDVTIGGGVNGGGAHLNDITVDGGTLTVMAVTSENPQPAGEDPELAGAIVGGEMTDGQLNVNGGMVTSPYIKFGITDNTGTFNMTGGVVNAGTLTGGNDGNLDVGVGTAMINISGGTATFGTVLLASTEGGHADMTISGTANVTIGGGGNTGGGAHLNDLTLDGGYLNVMPVTPNNPQPAGEDSELAEALVGGYLTNGAFNVYGGTASTPYLKLGISPGMTGTFIQQGGAVGLGTLCVGDDVTTDQGQGMGSVVLSGGSLTVGVLQVGSTAGSVNGNVNGVGTVAINGSANVSISSVANFLPGVSTLTMTGGTLTMENANLALPSGTTTISYDGTSANMPVLHLHNSIVSAGTTLSIGTATLDAGGSAVAGESTGSVSFSGVSLTLSNTSVLHMALGGAPTVSGNAGNAFDQITESGGIFTAGGATLQILPLSDAMVGVPYPIVVTGPGGSIDSSVFANLTIDPSYAMSASYSVTYDTTDDQIDVTFSSVPEPAGSLGILLGIGGWLLGRGRRVDPFRTYPR